LKLAQRERALARGIRQMTWTFDPLQGRNAHLNFARLGVTSDDYRLDYYGDVSTSPLHTATGTDRLWVTWQLDSERVLGRIAGRGEGASQRGRPLGAKCFDAARLVVVGEDGAPRVAGAVADAAGRPAVIEIPGEIGVLQRRDPALASEWRRVTRSAFVAALEAGYAVEEFLRVMRYGAAAGSYLLRRRDEGGKARQ
ncbi:MAG: hypothetical protein M3268_08125, partial [Acidobacteriota bacterium]|nr:hypothetical protein [Acidobacteriota bacterium]